jgi:C4-dicarboxylate-specific signal transduction histidine kinase
VWGDRIQLQQVILNLMVNSFEAMQNTNMANRRLTIQTCVADKERVLILTRDSGPGIPAAQLDHIFEPFFTTKPQGLGMGLAICRSIIQAHRGEISCENNPEGGVTFRVALPASRQAIL